MHVDARRKSEISRHKDGISTIAAAVTPSPRHDGDDPTPDNWILFPAKKAGRSVADDECNPVRFPPRSSHPLSPPPLSLPFSPTRVPRPLLPSLPVLPVGAAPTACRRRRRPPPPPSRGPLCVFLRALWFFSHSALCRISFSIRLIVRRDERENETRHVDRRKGTRRERGEGQKGAAGRKVVEAGERRDGSTELLLLSFSLPPSPLPPSSLSLSLSLSLSSLSLSLSFRPSARP